MITKWNYIYCTDENLWILPIWDKINSAVRNGLCKEPGSDIRELGLHINTRLNMLPFITKRINSEWKSLYSEIINYDEEYDFEDGKEGYAIPVKPENLYSLLIDIDSFLFEINSCCELMMDFLKELYLLLGVDIKKKDMGNKLKKILLDDGQDPEWFILLGKDRNFFTHNGTPYVAIDISNGHPDLLIMKENLKSFSDPEKFTKLSELEAVVKGFSDATVTLQFHIFSLFHPVGTKK